MEGVNKKVLLPSIYLYAHLKLRAVEIYYISPQQSEMLAHCALLLIIRISFHNFAQKNRFRNCAYYFCRFVHNRFRNAENFIFIGKIRKFLNFYYIGRNVFVCYSKTVCKNRRRRTMRSGRSYEYLYIVRFYYFF